MHVGYQRGALAGTYPLHNQQRVFEVFVDSHTNRQDLASFWHLHLEHCWKWQPSFRELLRSIVRQCHAFASTFSLSFGPANGQLDMLPAVLVLSFLEHMNSREYFLPRPANVHHHCFCFRQNVSGPCGTVQSWAHNQHWQVDRLPWLQMDARKHALGR